MPWKLGFRFEKPVLEVCEHSSSVKPISIGSDHDNGNVSSTSLGLELCLQVFVVGRLYELDPLARKKNLTTLFFFTLMPSFYSD